MARPRKVSDGIQADLFNVQELLTTAPCVPAIREAVTAWRKGGYKGITDTTRELLNYWFFTDHTLPGSSFPGRSRFRYHTAQREAIETLIYVVEVAGIRNRTALLEKYAMAQRGLRLPPDDPYARFAIKMATGSGKTKVMSMVVVWQYANAVKEGRDDRFARTFLIVAPNIIVFDRLKTDFGDGRIFKTDPLIPRHYQFWWDMDYYVRGDGERASSEGAVYLTNIQQFYDRPAKSSDPESDIMTAMLGTAPPAAKTEVSDFAERIAERPGTVLVLNDEAHHTHDEEGEWNKFIRRLHDSAHDEFTGVTAQLDFSATPRFSKGALFPWIISDYPLKQAILDKIVKRPIKGISQIDEPKSDIASVRYRGFLIAGVERWKEYCEQLSDLNKKPLLFVMMNDTKEADDVGGWLQERYPEHFGGSKLLVIHTNQSGEIAKSDLETSRRLAREVDESASPVNAIVSVLMLREGWDVQNVTVVVGLRPYTSKANILPEQTIGRGLRLMFRDHADSFQERVDIIGNKAFMEFVEDLEKLEDFKLDSFKLGQDKLKIVTIQPLSDKKAADISIPVITPLFDRKKSLANEIAGLDVMAFNVNVLPLRGKELAETKTFIYEGRDILTNEKLIEKKYEIPPAQTAEEVLGYYARRIAQDIKLPSQFAALVPKVRQFFSRKAFGVLIENLNEPEVIRAMSGNLANHIVVNEFRKALRYLIVEAKEPELVSANRQLSETLPFPFSRKLLDSPRTVFNYAACDNEYELAFAKFLDAVGEVDSFAKLPESFGFCIQYTDNLANIRNYYPDFVARLNDGSHWLLETKGREDVEVRLKDNAALNWCDAATNLTGVSWQYMKVMQRDFENLQPDSFADLQIAINPPLLF